MGASRFRPSHPCFLRFFIPGAGGGIMTSDAFSSLMKDQGPLHLIAFFSGFTAVLLFHVFHAWEVKS